MAAGMSSDSDAARLTDGLGTRWTLAETSFKFHASCRHTHPAADALQQILQRHQLAATDVKTVKAQVHQAAIDVLGPVIDPQTVHQSKFSMGTVLGLVAVHGRAGLAEFDGHYKDAAVTAFHDKVSMVIDAEVDNAYPARWIGKVQVDTMDGRRLEGRVDEPKGDPGNTLARDELEEKATRLALYRDGATAAEMQSVIGWVWSLASVPRVGTLLDPVMPV
jgi:2-methylcitrate dehydratase PrpD